jgi:hypothetical protein
MGLDDALEYITDDEQVGRLRGNSGGIQRGGGQGEDGSGVSWGHLMGMPSPVLGSGQRRRSSSLLGSFSAAPPSDFLPRPQVEVTPQSIRIRKDPQAKPQRGGKK